jgi:hypothetical protein
MSTIALTGGVQRAENPDQIVELFQFGPSIDVDSDSSDFVTIAAEESYVVPLMGLDEITVVIMYASIPLNVELSVGEDSLTFQTKYLVLFNSDITGITLNNISTTASATARIIIGG